MKMVKMTRRFELNGVRVDIEEIFGERISGETKYHGTHLWSGYFLLVQTLFYRAYVGPNLDYFGKFETEVFFRKISQYSQVPLFYLHF